MSLGFVMLCHTALGRAAQVARHWAERGCPVVVHVDARVPPKEFERLKADLQGLENLRYSRRYTCDWGTWGIVAATQDAAALMLAEFPGVRHVFLASGSCLPLRPVEELRAYLSEHPRTDFIESVTTADVGWTVGGLDAERFTLRFPFSWRKRRRLFDAYVRLQRRLKIRRRIPEGLMPHLGSQWWCLTRGTLDAILTDPRRAEIDRYFRRVWIPDESYFQTLVRRHSTTLESRSLTLAKFDFQGKPHIFYDDHLQLLRRSDCFVARKIWPQANRLYREFLSTSDTPMPRAEPNRAKIDRLFAKAVDRRVNGRPGLYMQSRFPAQDRENGKTAAPYSVFEGFGDVFQDFDSWLSRSLGGRVHFSGGERIYNGCLSDSAALRDYDPKMFLTNLVWATRGERQCFLFGPRDAQKIGDFFPFDVNAQVSVITGAWTVPLFRFPDRFSDVRREAARLQKIEMDHLTVLRSAPVKARVRIWSLAEFLENPVEPLQTILDELSPALSRRLNEVPRLVDLTGFGRFLQDLRNQGMQPTLVGDFQPGDDVPGPVTRRNRPYVVK